MTDTLATPRFTLPLLAVAQAQKEVTHNEALALLDALLHPAVEAGPVATPPPAPVAGQCWLVAGGADGEWSGRGGTIAIRTDGGWRFVAPRGGMRIIRLSDGALLRFEGQLSAFKAYDGRHACYRCLFPAPPPADLKRARLRI